MFLAISQFQVSNDHDEAVREAFQRRPHKVDEAPGFIRMEVAHPCDDRKAFWLLTWWRDAASFHAWHKSHAYRDSHSGIPKGLKLDPGATRMQYLEVFAQ